MDCFLNVTFSMSEWILFLLTLLLCTGFSRWGSFTILFSLSMSCCVCKNIQVWFSDLFNLPKTLWTSSISLFSAANTATFLLPRKLPQKEQSPLCTQQTGQSPVINPCFFFHTHSFTITFVHLILKGCFTLLQKILKYCQNYGHGSQFLFTQSLLYLHSPYPKTQTC